MLCYKPQNVESMAYIFAGDSVALSSLNFFVVGSARRIFSAIERIGLSRSPKVENGHKDRDKRDYNFPVNFRSAKVVRNIANWVGGYMYK